MIDPNVQKGEMKGMQELLLHSYMEIQPGKGKKFFH